MRRVERERGGVIGRAMGMGMGTEIEIEKMPRTGNGNGTIGRVKRPSGANLLRAAAAANSAKAAAESAVVAKGTSATSTGTVTVVRSSSVGRRAVEEARKALLRM